MKDKVFKFYADAGHAWLAVKLTDLMEFNIVGQITGYSYIKGKTAYIEEDMDMYTFCKAYEAKYGNLPISKYVSHGDRSPIRSYDRFDIANFNKAFSKE